MTDIDINTIINELVHALLPELNKQIPNIIKQEDLDPMSNVTSGSASPGKINLGLCHATCSANYSIKDMKGLSSINIESITIDSSSGSIDSFAANVTVKLKLVSNLSSRLSGNVEAHCGFIGENVGLSGTASATSIAAHASGVLSGGASIKEGEASLKSLKIESTHIDCGKIDVKIDYLEIFMIFLDPIVSSIATLFKKYITGSLDGVVQGVINDELSQILPINVKI